MFININENNLTISRSSHNLNVSKKNKYLCEKLVDAIVRSFKRKYATKNIV